MLSINLTTKNAFNFIFFTSVLIWTLLKSRFNNRL